MRVQALLEGAIESGCARLLACGAPSSGSWLNFLPTASLGLRFSDSEIRIAVGFWLGVPIVERHTCTCGVEVLPDGHNGLSCKRGPGRQSLHHAVNEIITRTLHSVSVSSIVEPTGLIRGDGKTPDGATLIPWSGGRPMLWDFTCPDTFAPSHLRKTSFLAGAAASVAKAIKVAKYSELLTTHQFLSVAVVPTHRGCVGGGVWGQGAETLLNHFIPNRHLCDDGYIACRNQSAYK